MSDEGSDLLELISINYDTVFETPYDLHKRYYLLKEKYNKLEIQNISNLLMITKLQKENQYLQTQLNQVEKTQNVLQQTIGQLLHKIMM